MESGYEGSNVGTEPNVRLVKLSRSEFLVELAEDDIRGHMAHTIDGEKIGHVDDLLIDEQQKCVRFLEVGKGGFLGIGEHKVLIPIEAVVRIDDANVFVGHTSDHIEAAPIYNPHVVQTEPYLYDVYEHYGYPPPWVPGAETR
jgi:sporulation protein YlmC with PRC-barrel domain